MTEAEWQECSDPAMMLVALTTGTWGKRKFRLWTTAAVRRVVDHWDGFGKFYHDALDIHLLYADDPAARDVLIEMRRRVARDCREFDRWNRDEFPWSYTSISNAVWSSLDPYQIDVAALLAQIRAAQKDIFERDAWATADGELCHLLRDIFGNPFRPLAFSSDWRTDTAVALARGMYESRDFGAMPILADALQDAGCDSADILDHCRQPGEHVRGCWVVDLVLGKE